MLFTFGFSTFRIYYISAIDDIRVSSSISVMHQRSYNFLQLYIGVIGDIRRISGINVIHQIFNCAHLLD